MSDSSYSDSPILSDIFDEEPTDPTIAISVAQRELDSAVSIVDGFVARGRALGYAGANSVDPPVPSWIDRLESELDGAEVLDGTEMDS